MSSNTEENGGSPEQEDCSLKDDEILETVHYPPEHMHVTADADLIMDKQCDIKTSESSDIDITEDEQLNTKRRSELKLLLALSKEANLDTNISYKRKSTDPVKLKDIMPLPLKPNVETDQAQPVKKIKIEKPEKFPITAESELETTTRESSNIMKEQTSLKIKKEEPKGKEIVAGEERKNIKDIKTFKPNKDVFCWRCHREGVNICCETCPRSYHQKCLKQTISNFDNWPCPECVAILKAESTQTRSTAMKGMTLEHLCSLLKFAVKRMIECNGSEPFLHPVNDKDFPDYKRYIIQPMNLTLLEKNIKENLYGSTQAFEADSKWILHNSIIFNSYQSKLTTSAKTIIKICKQEMAEVENCPSCYLNANTKKSTWFVEVCPKPHILVWAKLKGFPYWPAKAMCTNSAGMVDVRFFGAHDRAWVPSKECFLYSRRDPNSNKQKRNDIIECMREVEVYIANIKALYGEFNYAPFKLPYDPDTELKQLLLFIPRYKPNAPPPKRSRLSETKVKPSPEKEEEMKVENEQSKESKDPMEGYGTDDETMEDDSLNTNKRTMLMQETSDTAPNKEEEIQEDSEEYDSEEDDKIEPEMDDDTQANVSSNKLLRGNVRTRGGIVCSPGKVKIIPRRISEENHTRKRLSVDGSTTPIKLSRRNSDQSVKSDSSRLSALSDKINRVDISENVEFSLGNTSDSYITSSNDAETRKKPVQIEIENSELSISPQNKVKITDRLMKKLSSSDEDVSKSETEQEQADVKSQTDILLEKYKNLVKEKSREFASVATSSSFSSSSVTSKDLCESSSDLKLVVPKEKVETETINDVDLGSSIDNGSGESSISEKIETVSSEMVISSTDNSTNLIETKKNIDLEDSKSELEEVSPILGEQQSCKVEEVAKVPTKTAAKEEIPKKATVPNVKLIMPKKDSLNIQVKRKRAPESSTDSAKVDKPVDEIPLEKIEKPLKTDTTEVSTKIKKDSPVKEKIEDKIITKTEEKKEAKKTTEIKSAKREGTKEAVISKPTPEQNKTVKNVPIIQPELKKVEPINTVVNKELESKTNVNANLVSESTKIVKEKKVDNKEITATITESKELKPKQLGAENKVEHKAEPNSKAVGKAVEQTDSNSSDDQDVVLDQTLIDQTNIRNIIHSSLNKTETSKRPSEETTKEKKIPQKKDIGSKEESKDSPNLRPTKKPKLNDEREKELRKEPNFKIVPIQSILNKAIENKLSDQSVLTGNPILLKKLSQPEVPKTAVNIINQEELVCVEIKSEPDSSEEEIEESEYMEKKRNYMSALNISERTEEMAVPKKYEIRTRSKTEEIGKGRHLDNLSKIIEEVATTFSAKHETIRKPMRPNQQPMMSSQVVDDRRRVSVQENGEIFVKSFAKLPQQQQQQMRVAQLGGQQRPQLPQKPKPAPTPSFSLKTLVAPPSRRDVPQKPTAEFITSTTLTRMTPTSSIVTTGTQQHQPTLTSAGNKALETLSSSGNVLILTQPGVILPTSQQLTYNAGSFVTFVPSQQNMAMMQTSQVINAVMAPGLHQGDNVQSGRQPNVEIHRSQNYIPQNEDQAAANAQKLAASNPPPLSSINGSTQVPSIHNSEVPPVIPTTGADNPSTSTALPPVAATENRTGTTGDDEFSLLHSLVPESVSRAISEVLCRPPPKLKPRPPGPLSQVFESGNPSTAGPVSAKINSISHRLSDYFRGMLIEMLEDLGKSNTPEATISSLKHEIETLQHKHAAEMMDIRKNVCTILKDIQGSIVEERERIVDETRSACELEALRRIEEAKSKQWCANCGKEAQFYCCWNTSYCDYPCQQKHWAKHMGKCTQHAGQPQPSQTPTIRPQGQITFRPATPKAFTGRIVAKPTKVYLNRSANPKTVPSFKATPGGHLTLVDTSNLEFLTSTSMGAKFIASSSLFTKVKTVNSTVTSPSNGTQQTVVLNQKMNNSIQAVKPSPSTSKNVVTNVISDEEMESE